MGAASSSLSELQNNTFLKRFVSSEEITRNDPFYNQLLSFQIALPNTISDNRLLEESIKPLVSLLLLNNPNTGNLASLILVFISRATELKASVQLKNRLFTYQSLNAIFIIRCIVKCLIELLSELDVINLLQTPPKSKGEDDASNLVEQLVCALVEIIVDVPLVRETMNLHWEATTLLIVCSSSHIYAVGSSPKYVILKYLMTGKPAIHACLFTKTLINRVICDQFNEDGVGSSIIIGMASSFWNALTSSLSTEEETGGSFSPLALQSLLLLLILVHHCPFSKSSQNPYRTALLNAQNVQETNECVPTEAVATFKVEYASLFSAVCKHLSQEHVTLLLYILLYKNTNFRTFVLARTDIETMLLPVLKVLYRAPENSSHHIYMSLIILLILSEDDSYNKIIHDITLKNLSWFSEKPLIEISLGGILILVVIRTIMLNMTEMRDKYLHTNCLAALANMSNQFRDLHPYVCDRVVTLLEILSRRHSRLRLTLTGAAIASANHAEDDVSVKINDLGVLEEVLRMVLEILNSTLTNQLSNNHSLIYSLLYKRELFRVLGALPDFEDQSTNIGIILDFLMKKFESSTEHPSVSSVQEIIKDSVMHIPREKLKKMSDLRFRYVEESEPEEFFIPYVWTLVYRYSKLYWDASRITLFEAKAQDKL